MSEYSEFKDRPELLKRKNRRDYWLRLIAITVVIYVVVSSGLAAVNAISSFQSRGRLLDCTTPHHKCYDEGAKKSADIVQQLLDILGNRTKKTRAIVKDAAYCADQPGAETRKELERCIRQQLKEGK